MSILEKAAALRAAHHHPVERKRPEENGERLASILRKEGDEIRLNWAEYNGHKFLNIRVWAEGEDGTWFRHGGTLHESSTRVPLIVKPPGGRRPSAPARWAGSVSLVDVAPTVLDYLGMSATHMDDGLSLREIVEAGEGQA